jgi:hypothetical protein
MKNMTRTPALSALALACGVVLVACGAGNAPTTSKSIAISGTVVDGAIQGATVFLDLNNNQTKDDGEPASAPTAEDGSFKIDASALTAAQIQAAHLVALIPATAKDADDNGQTLAEAGKASYSLIAPTVAYAAIDGSASGAMVSPITTLVSHDMIVDGSKSLAEATQAVKTRLGLPEGTSLTQDPSKNPDLKITAQVIASAIGEVTKLARDGGASGRDALLAGLSYVQGNIVQLKKAVDAAADAAPVNAKPASSATVKSLLAGNGSAAPTGADANLKPDTSSLLAAAKQTSQTSLGNVNDMLVEGSYAGCLDSTYCTPLDYTKFHGTASTWSFDFKVLSEGAWVAFSNSGYGFVLTPSGWIDSSSAGRNTGGTWTPDGVGGLASSSDGWQARATLRTQDVAGKKFSEINGADLPSSYANYVFPVGSKVFYVSMNNLKPSYTLSAGFAPGAYGDNPGYASLAAFIDALRTPSLGNPSSNTISSNGLAFSFNETSSTAIAAGSGTVRRYVCSLGFEAALSGCDGGTWTPGSNAAYVIETVHGQSVLKIDAPYGPHGSQLIFSVVNGKVLGGDFTPANVWTPSQLRFNKTAFDAILQAGSRPVTVN